jgi:hypothetical protein
LLAWQKITTNVSQGFTSTALIQQVLESAGLKVEVNPGERTSQAFERLFARVDTARPGDLILYAGTAPGDFGHFAVLYIGPSQRGANGVVIGAWQHDAPLQVIDSYYFDKQPPVTDRLIGFFRPPYKD